MTRRNGRSAKLVALAAVFAAAACDPKEHTGVAAAKSVTPNELGACGYEISFPKDASFREVTSDLARSGLQFCEWASFPERRAVGFLISRERTSCASSLTDFRKAGVSAQAFSSFNDFGSRCLVGGTQIEGMPSHAHVEPLCFAINEEKEPPALRYPDYKRAVRLSLGKILYQNYTLPVLFVGLEGDVLTFWLRQNSDDWSGSLVPNIIDAAASEGFKLQAVACDPR